MPRSSWGCCSSTAGGAEVGSVFPVVPLSERHALAVGVLSYRDVLSVALHADPVALPHVEEIVGMVEAATQDLERALGLRSQEPAGVDPDQTGSSGSPAQTTLRRALAA